VQAVGEQHDAGVVVRQHPGDDPREAGMTEHLGGAAAAGRPPRPEAEALALVRARREERGDRRTSPRTRPAQRGQQCLAPGEQVAGRREEPGVTGHATEGVEGVAVIDLAGTDADPPPVVGTGGDRHRVGLAGGEHPALDVVARRTAGEVVAVRRCVRRVVEAKRTEHQVVDDVRQRAAVGNHGAEKHEAEVGVVAAGAALVSRRESQDDIDRLGGGPRVDVERPPLPQARPVEQHLAAGHVGERRPGRARQQVRQRRVEGECTSVQQRQQGGRRGDDLGQRPEVVGRPGRHRERVLELPGVAEHLPMSGRDHGPAGG
jgi:hypothetical protein